MLAKDTDIFNRSTWIALFVICLGAPLAGFIIGWVLGGQRYLKTRWNWIVGYYAMACIPSALLFSTNSFAIQSAEFLGCCLMIFMLLGPVLGFALYTIPLRGVRYPDGHCQTCGYDLTGDISGKCSECGTEIGHQGDQDELARQHTRARMPWLFGAFTLAILVALPSISQSGSSFLIGFWTLALVVLVPLTIMVVLRRL